jgi:hypothetical protein
MMIMMIELQAHRKVADKNNDAMEHLLARSRDEATQVPMSIVTTKISCLMKMSCRRSLKRRTLKQVPQGAQSAGRRKRQ